MDRDGVADAWTDRLRDEQRQRADRWVYGPAAGGSGGRAVGQLPYSSACCRGRAGHTHELPVFSPCSWPWQEAREQGVYGEFSFQRGASDCR